MYNISIPFSFEEKDYVASVTQINPPPDKQWHFFLNDDSLIQRFGNPHIIFWNKPNSEYTYGFPTPAPDARQFMHTLAEALNKYLHENGLMPNY